VFDVYRRIFFIGVLPLISDSDEKRAWIGMFAAFVFVVVLIQLEPFVDPMTNEVLSASQFQKFFTYMAALAISTDAVKLFNFSDSSLGVGLCLVNIIVIIMVFTNASRRLRSQLKTVPLASGMLWHFFISHAQVQTWPYVHSSLINLNFLVSPREQGTSGDQAMSIFSRFQIWNVLSW